ncbi:hypothetical protein NJ7G_2146 [Natrinema sp. J7-2]|nr:hypothetical protein NJ7G_2146 [Natrinema sp. J7-2]
MAVREYRLVIGISDLGRGYDIGVDPETVAGRIGIRNTTGESRRPTDYGKADSSDQKNQLFG